MLLCLTDKKDKTTYIELAEMVTEEQGLTFLHSLDFKNLYEASLCHDNGIIIYKITTIEKRV